MIGVIIAAPRMETRLTGEMAPSTFWRIVLTGTGQVTEVEARDRAVAGVEGRKQG